MGGFWTGIIEPGLFLLHAFSGRFPLQYPQQIQDPSSQQYNLRDGDESIYDEYAWQYPLHQAIAMIVE